MGFKREKIYRLVFDEGHELGPSEENPEGLVVRTTTIPLRDYLDVDAIVMRQTLPAKFTDGDDAIDWVFGVFSEALISWTLVDKNGEPVGTGKDDILTQDRELVYLVMGDWLEALRTVRRPLRKPSTGGERSVAVSIPMETLSESQAS